MEIEGFEWDEDNEPKLQRRLSPDEIDSVLELPWGLVRNKNQRAGTHKLLGATRGGRRITVIITPTGRPGIWRPVNAWPSDKDEVAHGKRAGVYK